MLTTTRETGKPFALKKRVVAEYEPPIIGSRPERRRCKFITFKEEDLETTEKTIREYFAFVAEEIQTRLIRL